MKLDLFRPSFIALTDSYVLDASGKDASSFLHRLSTNHVQDLEDGEVCLSSFLDQKGRLVSVCYIQRIAANHFRLMMPYAPVASLQGWLDQFLFAEEVELFDASDQFALIWLIGSKDGEIIGPDFHFHDGATPSSLFLAPKGQLKKPECHELSKNEFEALRVAGAVPYSAHEINANFNPLQLGLGNTVHWAKGCYIGQEVISRLESKEKAGKTLLAGRVAPHDLPKLRLGEAVHTDDGPVGILTSVASITISHEANVLFVLKRPQAITHAHTVLSNVRIDIMKQRD